ncbi:3-oxoadipate enol-lactone hydrolase/4-carboxymuconolactone decarboxylase [Rhodococcus sp. AW25M09]|uniref:bifunctional 3-oxoadipate enol-lactonase/4-carboxymuconolactone decarboxylase PcaDC n=1 Tax=Rhodococcus sp. AW25M09 TaxID=1268303 RepID=UPI0002ACC3B0|nr:3-oxoadipate enol-lactonase [Rhodococcus sp. AW25M09]CCQ15965.1 3-oxoadipate enol-lactone hydrolase/4-carboxymuconolactone decarboxylase [Rhodococcus sp. AW25M09]
MTVALAHERTEGPHPDSDTVVLIGSLGSDRSMWNPQVGSLSASAHVLAVDIRGHGQSPVPAGPYSIAELAQDVLTLLDSLALVRVHVVGLSIGGAIAQWIAIHRPERVRTLTLLCTSAKFGEPTQWTDRAATVRASGTSALADVALTRWFTAELLARDSDLAERHRRMIADTPDEGYAACCEALSQWDSRADLTRISAPTLVLAGLQDPATTPEDLLVIADGIAGSTYRVLDPAAHLANVEQAGPVTAAIATHIGSTACSVGRAAAHDTGMTVRRSVLGDAHVDRSIAARTDFTAPFQDFITRTAWGDIWNRPGLDHKTRRLLTLAILTAVGNQHELDMHIRAALRAGSEPDELAEVFLHTAVYAGVPNSNSAFALANAAIAEASTADDTESVDS